MSKLIEALESIKRNINGIKNDEEAFHRIREDAMRMLLEHKNLELKLLMRWDEMDKAMDIVIEETKRITRRHDGQKTN